MAEITVLLNNEFPIQITSFKATSTRERFVSTVDLDIAFANDLTTQNDIYNTALMLNDQHSVVCIYIDGVRYFTGFVESANDSETLSQYSTSITLKSKTIDIMQSTYIPINFDSINGGANFFTNIWKPLLTKDYRRMYVFTLCLLNLCLQG